MRHAIGVGCAGIAAVALAVSGCGSSGSDDSSNSSSTQATGSGGKTLTVGYVGGFTGILAPYDGGVLQGLKPALAKLNAAAGADGTKIELVTRDSRSEPAEAVASAQDLISSGVKLLITPCDADPSLAAGAVAQKAGVPAISSCATSPTLPKDVGDHMFLSVQGDNAQGAVLANYAMQKGAKTAYLLGSPDSGYTEEIPRYFGEAFKANGGKIVGEDTFKLGGQDFNAQVTKIRQLSPAPDVVMTSAYLPDFPVLVKQLRAAGVKSLVLGVDALDSPETITASGAAANGVVFTTHAFPTPGSALERYYADFKQQTGKPAESIFTAIGSDVATIIAAAAEQAHSTDSAKLRDALASLKDVKATTGTVTYDPQLRLPKKAEALVQIEDGKFKLVKDVPYPDNVPAP